MAAVLKKEYIYQVLFFISIGLPYLNNYEVIFSVWSLMALVTLRKRYSWGIIKCISYFIAIFIIAFVVSFFHNVALYEYVRDIAYLLKPIIGLVLGYQLCKDYLESPLKIFINTGIAIAIIHLIVICYAILILHARTMPELRMHSGYFSDFEVYALIFLLFNKKFGIPVTKRYFTIGVVLMSVSIFMYLARTNFIQFAILALAAGGYMVLNKKAVRTIVIASVIILMGYGAIYYYNPARKQKGIEALLYKIKNSPIEPFKTKVDVNDWKDFNDNYRSYETILTIRQTKQEGTAAILVGQGMGSSVDLKKKVWLQSSFMRYIPFLHNGFMTVLLKSGLLGDIILIFSIAFFFRKIKTDIPEAQAMNNIFVGTGVFLICSYWVFMGLYFVPDTKSVLLGFLIRYRELIFKRNQLLPKAE